MAFHLLPDKNKNDLVVKYSLPENNNTILASQYQLYLPTEEQLLTEIRKLNKLK